MAERSIPSVLVLEKLSIFCHGVWRAGDLSGACLGSEPPALHARRRLRSRSNGLELGGDGGAEEDRDGRQERPDLKRNNPCQPPVHVAKRRAGPECWNGLDGGLAGQRGGVHAPVVRQPKRPRCARYGVLALGERLPFCVTGRGHGIKQDLLRPLKALCETCVSVWAEFHDAHGV